MPLISIRNITKKYHTFNSDWDRFIEAITSGKVKRRQEHWILKGISLEAEAGESIGIIGYNGAGKSTLLKIVLGVSTPDTGTVSINGRVAGLLELGVGFHPEFTGRENAVISCQLLGLDPAEIPPLVEEIKAFSELHEYFDEPMRTYSTGMAMRLAFSASTVVRPEILVVDEALSVGDAYFQHKSMARIRRFREAGTTLFLVSHDPTAIKSLCDRAVILEDGVMIRDGRPDEVLDYYQAMVNRRKKDEEIRQFQGDGVLVTRSGDARMQIASIEVLDMEGRPGRVFKTGETARIRQTIICNDPSVRPNVGILIRDRLGNHVYGTNTNLKKIVIDDEFQVGSRFHVDFDVQLLLGGGTYNVTVAVVDDALHSSHLDWIDQAIVFQVMPESIPDFAGLTPLRTSISYSPGAAPGADVEEAAVAEVHA
ncbi:sugar ABC transporter ATP-binding protein [Skermanella stibiiresistens SB22]|uniref:Sugar ABC transporter ATP-binding protein n=1 Tax=Skermanella stibiiresistens SB22 TaxID=1385369 RepID=W9H9H2_9PROT|nr:ABC transporter ATP-binding protein [Skermanella stibiiresistens]EWY41342.1 sugar ABC transporter ATP-binding protein [Skermanella stibiiresistens SB22]